METFYLTKVSNVSSNACHIFLFADHVGILKNFCCIMKSSISNV